MTASISISAVSPPCHDRTRRSGKRCGTRASVAAERRTHDAWPSNERIADDSAGYLRLGRAALRVCFSVVGAADGKGDLSRPPRPPPTRRPGCGGCFPVGGDHQVADREPWLKLHSSGESTGSAVVRVTDSLDTQPVFRGRPASMWKAHSLGDRQGPAPSGTGPVAGHHPSAAPRRGRGRATSAGSRDLPARGADRVPGPVGDGAAWRRARWPDGL